MSEYNYFPYIQKYMEIKCYKCSKKLLISSNNFYNLNDAQMFGLTTTKIPDFSHFKNANGVFPLAWENNENEKLCVYSVCSYKCLRQFWRINFDDSDSDYEESIIKKRRM